MDTIRIFVIFFSLYSSNSAHPSVPSIIVQEGQSAEISCLAKGNHDAYFWWKGEYLHNSTEIASFVGGIPSSPTGSYKATENGTLIIKKVSLDDEGKYICRVLSELSDCKGEILVFVQASIPGFSLGIDPCNRDASCVIQIKPSKPTKLTCRAIDASPSMALKWFNGSSEITEGIKHESPVMTGTSRVISATLNVAPECTGSLICQAVDAKAKDDCGRFAQVQLELPGSDIRGASTCWMVTAIMFLVTCIILIAAFVFIKVKLRKTKGKEKRKPEEGEQLMKFHDKDSKIKADQEKIEELTTKVSDKDSEIKIKDEQIMKLKAETHIKDNELQVKVRELMKSQKEFHKKDNEMKSNVEEISRLKELIQSNDEVAKRQDNLVAKLNEVIRSNDELTKCQDNELNRLNEVIRSSAEVTKCQDNELNRLNNVIQAKDKVINCQYDLTSKLKEVIRSKDEVIKRQDNQLNQLDNVIQAKDEVINCQKNLLAELEPATGSS